MKPHRFQWEAVATEWKSNWNEGDYPRLTYWPMFWKRLGVIGLFDLAQNTLGCSLFYMDHLNAPWDGDQRRRVDKLCRRLAADGWPRRWKDTRKNRAWFHKFLAEVCEEVENQC